MANVSESFKSQLKQKAKTFLPTDMNTVEAQRNVLYMVETVAPMVSACRKHAEEKLWPKAKAGEMSVQDARKQCAVFLNKLAAITIVENLKLERHSKENLQKAWVAMDSYAMLLKPEESAKLRGLMDEIAAVLEQKETGRRPAAQQSSVPEMSTVPIDTSKITIPDLKTVETPKPVVPAAGTSGSQPADDEYTDFGGKRRTNPLVMVIVAVIVVAIAAVCISMAWKQVSINNTEKAISAIGTVTMESSGAVKDAELAYSKLSDEQKEQVENYDVLVAARAELDRLEKLVQDAVDAIEDIGKVTLDSGSKIQKARKAYDALEADNLTSYVAEQGEILVAAEEEYEKLHGEKLFTDGQKLFQAEEYDEALKKFDELVKKYPKHTRIANAKVYAAKCMVVKAQESFDAREYETTMELLTEGKAKYGDSAENQELMDKLIKKLEDQRPKQNGKKFKEGVKWGYGTLEVTAGDKDVIVKLVSLTDPEAYTLFYVYAGTTQKINAANGDYKVLYGTGDYWYGDKVGFGKTGEYYEVSRTYSFTTSREGSVIWYNARTLNLSEKVSATKVTYNQFWN